MTKKTEPSIQAPAEASGNEGARSADAAPPQENARPAEDLYRQLLGLKAEFENYRKRVDRERPEWIKMGEARLWERLLPIYDVLLQAHGQVVRLSSAEGAGSKELARGLELVFKEFNKIFEAEGVQIIETVGKPYHHDLHEVLGALEADQYPEGTVVEELQRGYLLKGKVLRPARVRIAKKKAGESPAAAPEAQ